jgi:hypothetical protein
MLSGGAVQPLKSGSGSRNSTFLRAQHSAEIQPVRDLLSEESRFQAAPQSAVPSVNDDGSVKRETTEPKCDGRNRKKSARQFDKIRSAKRTSFHGLATSAFLAINGKSDCGLAFVTTLR